MERVAEQPVEDRTGRAGIVRRAHLSENLALAGHHRVEAGGDTKEMERSGLVPEPVQRRAELLLECEQSRLGLPLRRVGGLLRKVELGPIAGRQADGLATLAGQSAREITRAIEVERSALAQLDGRLVVRNADEDDTHRHAVRR